MSEARQPPSPERMRELADTARDDGLDNLAAWLEECAAEAEASTDE